MTVTKPLQVEIDLLTMEIVNVEGGRVNVGQSWQRRIQVKHTGGEETACRAEHSRGAARPIVSRQGGGSP